MEVLNTLFSHSLVFNQKTHSFAVFVFFLGGSGGGGGGGGGLGTMREVRLLKEKRC